MITSSSNEKIKNIRKLRNRKYRDEAGIFFIEGSRIVIEALQQKAGITEIFFTPQYGESKIGKQVIDQAVKLNYLTNEVSESVFESISVKEGPQGIGAVVKQKWGDFSNLKKEFTGVWVALSKIADPGNLGTILRTCDATATKGIILIGNCTDPYDPTALRASMGAVFTRELIRITEEEFASWVAENQINVVGTSDASKEDFRAYRYPMNMVLAMGSEREGLPEIVQRVCSETVSIAMKGSCDSLNLAVATGVMLYEILYQHESKKKD